MTKFPKLENRRRIYDLLLKNPGLHLSKIAELLNIRISLAEYHLLFLEKHNIIITISETGYRRYYIKGVTIGPKEKRILAVLRQEIPLKIVLFLLKNQNATHKEILERFEIAKSTLSYHLKKLVNRGIINIQMLNNEKTYKVMNENEIMMLLIRFKPYRLLDGFKDIWADLTVD